MSDGGGGNSPPKEKYMPAIKLNRFDFIEYVRTHGRSEMSVGALLGIFDHLVEIEEQNGQTYFVESPMAAGCGSIWKKLESG